jgi:hypothetical protein
MLLSVTVAEFVVSEDVPPLSVKGSPSSFTAWSRTVLAA